MEFSDVIKNRYSCRTFADRAVEQEKINALLAAALMAPTARNQQPIKIKVITSESDREKLKLVTPCHFNAPLALLFCFTEDECWVRPDDGLCSGYIDASIVETHVMLRAYDLGLGSTWVLKFDPFAAREQFEIPKGVIPAGFLMLGYPSDAAEPTPRHFESKSVDEILLG